MAIKNKLNHQLMLDYAYNLLLNLYKNSINLFLSTSWPLAGMYNNNLHLLYLVPPCKYIYHEILIIFMELKILPRYNINS